MLLHAELGPGRPEEYLSWDEAFLASVEEGGPDVLWFWEAPVPFVVVGYGQSVDREVHRDRCAAASIPILRRCSGGGTVVQGPGCLNYGLALRVEGPRPLGSVTETNRFIMDRQRDILSPLLPGPVAVHGHTDLAVAGPDGVWRKFSGNAQRRTRSAVLFHGTILCRFPLDLLGELLRAPSTEPEYRRGRDHAAFVTNTGLDPGVVREACRRGWGATEPLRPWPRGAQAAALQSRYDDPGWHFRR